MTDWSICSVVWMLVGKSQHALAHPDHVPQCSCVIGAVHPANCCVRGIDVAKCSIVSEPGCRRSFPVVSIEKKVQDDGTSMLDAGEKRRSELLLLGELIGWG